ncbi:MAG: hypothetical protein JRF56_19160 [Deltaproteobacteria bacterium]|jgi:hypothetical protein|nr:hypothetical protein [Deltaproteobacteria bacterium]
MSKYEVQISEPWDFEHPSATNTFTVYGVGVIPGPDKPNYASHFFLVNVDNPFIMGGELVKQLVCAPRYEGDTMEMVVHSKCTVGIARVKSEFSLENTSTVNPEEIVYCAVGFIKTI